MCRYDPATKTERRCPSYLNRDSYNAKRRARYKERKNGNAFTKTPLEQLPVVSDSVDQPFLYFDLYALDRFDTKAESVNDLFKSYNGLGNFGQSKFKKSYVVDSEQEEYFEDLNVHVQECSGSLTNVKYFNSKIFSGKIDHTKLDENSYKIFFDTPKKDEELNCFIFEDSSLANRKNDYNALSELELMDATEDEKKAIEFYTGDDYEWFNSLLYKEGKSDYLTNLEDTKDYDYSVFKSLKFEGSTIYEKLNNVTKNLDSVISKGPGIPRKVYRGVSSSSGFFNGTSLDEWVNNLTLGQEIKVDGYQSATQSGTTAYNFVDCKGVMFEIITPEGIQISKESTWTGEFETLLPRDSRYSVVGIHKPSPGDESIYVVQMIAIDSSGEILDGTFKEDRKPKTFS